MSFCSKCGQKDILFLQSGISPRASQPVGITGFEVGERGRRFLDSAG